jgi:hypothetical protein
MIALLLDSKKIDLACIYGNCFERGTSDSKNEAFHRLQRVQAKVYKSHNK